MSGSDVVLQCTVAKLTATGATALNSTFGATAFNEGIPLGVVTLIPARADAPKALTKRHGTGRCDGSISRRAEPHSHMSPRRRTGLLASNGECIGCAQANVGPGPRLSQTSVEDQTDQRGDSGGGVVPDGRQRQCHIGDPPIGASRSGRLRRAPRHRQVCLSA